MWVLAAALTLALMPGVGLAETADTDQPIHIRADRAQIDRHAQTIVYSGGVQVDQGSMRLLADELTVEYEDQTVVRITAEGAPARYRQELDSDLGLVQASSRTIVYDTRQEQLRLQGDALLTQGGNEIAGELIRYDMVAGRVDAEAGDDRPVRVTVQPPNRSE
ncbi:MAG: lipopolysaccharide transport periplasmic protein LptA [Pseudomonadales bacterium]